ncbi:MAG: alpha/beta hydrolase [Archangiaceae bacterium]|nr:alpha/beta hydrolase [Archangiaceae bacterium]
MSRRDEGFFSARDNTRLYWQSQLPDGEFTSVVGVVHGYGDHSGRYRRVIDYLVSQGHGVLAFDYRGHGKADGKRGHVTEWSEYLGDMEVFWARVRQLASGKPTFVLAHSHGGLMATHFAARRPEGLKGLVLSAPFYRLAMKPPRVKTFAATLLANVLPSVPVATGLSPALLSRDVEWQRETAEDPLYGKAATPRWYVEHRKAQEALTGLGAQLVLPVLMVTGGSDPVASTPAARGFFETIASSDKTYKEYPGMLHEVLCEQGKEEVWADISRWLSAHR